ncbi:MAG: M24 family metallopeptidase [Candidatus Thorarchaeota archaeon]
MQFTPQRLDKVHRAMRREEIDALLVTRRQDVQYLTGFQYRGVTIPICCIITEDHQPQLVLPDKPELVSPRESMMAKLRPFNETSFDAWSRTRGVEFWDQVTGILKELGHTGSMIGLQHDRLSVREFEKLKQALPEAGFKDFSPSLWTLRYIKDAAEIDAIRKAVNISEIGVRTALEVVATGKSEEDVSLEIESAMRSAGGQQRGIRAAVLSGVDAHLPFAEPGVSRISADDLVVLDMTVSHSGYFGELARTIHLGKPSEKQRKLFDYVMNSTRLLEKRLKPGAQLKDLAEKTLKKLGKSFPSDTIIQPLGNSIGLDLYEPPYIVLEAQQSLREGMVLSIHPTGYAPGVGAVKIADVVLITQDGFENLTALARETM